MKKLILVGAFALLTAMMSSCYKHTVCATYTKTIDTIELEKNNDNL